MSEIKSLEKLRSRILLKDIFVRGERMSDNNEAYERANGYANKLADEIEAEIAEKYMELPVDADGVPIHVGDVMCSDGIHEKGHKVVVSAIFEDGFVEYGSENGLIGPLHQEDWVHVKPDPLKELLNDYLKEREKIVRKIERSMITLGEGESEEDACDKLFAERIREMMKDGGE